MGRVIYNGARLIPAPFVTIQKTYNRLGGAEGEIVSSEYSIVLEGTVMAWKGSPNSNGTFWTLGGEPPDENIAVDSRLKAILEKQEALRGLFSAGNDGKKLEIQSDDGSQPLIIYPKILDITFPQDAWFEKCNYTIQLSADKVYPLTDDDFPFNILSASETWSLDPENTPESYSLQTNNQLQTASYFRLTHSLNAQGRRSYEADGTVVKEPWENAKDWVISKLGIDQDIVASSGVNNLPSYYTGKDHFRAESIDVTGGSFAVNETWLLTSGNVIEDFTVSIARDISNPVTSVTVDGSIRGLEEKNGDMQVTTSRFSNADSYFSGIQTTIFQRAQSSYGSKPLHSDPVNYNIGKNPANGTVSYNYSYNTRPSGLITNALSEVINVGYMDGGDKFASVFVLGRKAGPVLQGLGSTDGKSKNLSIEAVFEPDLDPSNILTSFQFPYSRISGVVEQLNPENEGATKVFRSPAQKSYDPINGRLSYNITWSYEN